MIFVLLRLEGACNNSSLSLPSDRVEASQGIIETVNKRHSEGMGAGADINPQCLKNAYKRQDVGIARASERLGRRY